MAEETISTRIVANADFSALIADVHKVTASLSKLQETLANSNKMMANQIAVMNRSFSETLRSTGQFSTHFVSLQSDVEKFGRNLDSGKLKLGQYFNAFRDHARTSGGLIRELAKQQVALQNAVLQPLGKNAQGLMQFNVHVPRGLDVVKNKTAILRQELQIMNRVMQDGAQGLINWGKNTQWAGRQLTVGLTVPLVAFGAAAAKAFKEADQELVRLTKVYGDLAGTSAVELGRVRKDVSDTAKELASAMGVSFKETIGLAADIAATGKTGNELLGSLTETTRLAVLGEVDRQEAMKATLAIQSAFKQNTEELSDTINFLNAVENQTSTTLNDLVEAIPKAGPVIKGLGGSIKDLALFLTAMREGGINATEGANALKSALASLINPTDVAVAKFQSFGIDLLGIVNKNAGNVTATLFALQAALDRLNPLQKQQAIEQLFGKFQFSRLNALFENLGRQGSQTLQVLDLMKASTGELASVADRELGIVTESASGKYRRAIESLRASLAEVGEQFLQINTVLIQVIDKVVKFANNLPGPVKQVLALAGGFTAIIGPVIMLTGVLANFFGYIVKGIFHMKALFKGGEGWKYLTPEMLAAEKAGRLVEQSFYSDAKAAAVLQQALRNLLDEFALLESKAKAGAFSVNPAVSTMAGNLVMGAGVRVVDPAHPLAGEKGTRASTHMVSRGSMTDEQRLQQTMFGMVPGSTKVNQKIGQAPQIYMTGRLPDVPGLTTIGGISTGIVSQEAARHHAMLATLAMQSKLEIAELKKVISTTGVIGKDFINQFDDILPIVMRLTDNAARESALIVSELRAGKITVESAKAKIIALNLETERMISSSMSAHAASIGRTFNPTVVPTLNQPVVGPTGKSNMRELFKKGKTRDFINNIARALGVRTWGAGYNIETTVPKKFNTGGYIYGMQGGDIVPGPDVNADVVPAMLTPGEFVVNKEATAQNLPLLMTINEGYNMGGKVRRGIKGYRQIAATIATIKAIQARRAAADAHSKQQRSQGAVQTGTRTSISRFLINSLNSKAERSAAAQILYRGTSHQDRAHIGRSVSEMAYAQTPDIYKKYFSVASVNPFNRTQNALSRHLGTKDVNVVTDRTAIEETLPQLFEKLGAGNWWKRFGAPGGQINRNEVDEYLVHLSKYIDRKAEWQPVGKPFAKYGKIPTNLVDAIRNDKFGKDDLAAYVNYLLSGEVQSINRLGIIANDASALLELKGGSPEAAIKQATAIYEATLGSQKGMTDRQYVIARAKHTAENYPEFIHKFRPKAAKPARAARSGGIIRGYNRGGLIPGYMNGGKIPGVTYAQKGILAEAKQKGFFGFGGAGGAKSRMTGVGVGMGMQFAGMGATMMGQSGLGTALQMASWLPMIAPGSLGLITKLISGFTSFSKILSVVRGALVLVTRAIPGAAVLAGIFGIIKAFQTWRKNIEDAKREAVALNGISQKGAAEAKIKYVDLSKSIALANEELKLARERGLAAYAAYTSAGVPGLTLTIKQLKDLKKEVKETMPETLATFNSIDASKVVDLARNLQAQYVAGGMGVEEATNKIYALVEASNKAGMGLSAISSQGFTAIKDKATAAESQMNAFKKTLDNIANTDSSAFASGVDTVIGSLEAAVQSLVGTKDASGQTITEAQAIAIQFEKIAKSGLKNKEIGAQGLANLQKHKPELAAIINSSDTVASIYAKWKIALSGVSVDLKNITAEQAQSIAMYQEALGQAAKSVQTNTKSGAGLENSARAVDKLNKEIKAAEKISAAAAKGESRSSKERARAIQDEIKAIRERADAKKKALRDTFDKENAELELQKAKLDLQNAVARGDNEAAAAAQIRIQQIQKETSLKAAEAKIDENAKKEEAKKQKELDAINKKNEDIQYAGQTAGNTAAQRTTVRDQITALQGRLTAAAVQQNNINDMAAGEKKTEAQNILDAERKKIFDDLKKASEEVQKAFTEYIDPKTDKLRVGIPLATGLTQGAGGAFYNLTDKVKQQAVINYEEMKKVVGGGMTNADIVAAIQGNPVNGKPKPGIAPTYTSGAGSRSGAPRSPDSPDTAYRARYTPGTVTTISGKKVIYDENLKPISIKDNPTEAQRIAKAFNVKLARGGRIVPGIPYTLNDGGKIEGIRFDMPGMVYPNANTMPKFNIPTQTKLSGVNSFSNSSSNSIYNIDIDLNGTNVTAEDVLNSFKRELALVNAKEGRSRSLGGNY